MITPVNPVFDLTDYSALQDDLTALLLSHAPLRKVNATQERKFLMDSSLAVDALWMTPRNDGVGAGIIVEDIRPVARDGGSTPGPVSDLLCGFVVLAERNLAMSPAGCRLHPEQIEQIIVDLLHLKLLQPYGQLKADGNYGGPATDWINDESGIYARRVTLKMLNARKQTVTCDLLTLSQIGLSVTLACNSPADGLQIYYTTDGSFPANDVAINAATNLYTDPFTAEAGTIIRAIAYAPGLNPSALKQLTVV